ncbi:MAG: Urease accessory protein UreF [Labilithrix sp.]|nr:Urease accessory protein UreF [Labilithrix sp.]
MPSSSSRTWLLLQLADGTFPSGGFAHSAGLEAATVLGGVGAAAGAPAGFLDASLRQLGRAALPFVRAAAVAPEDLAALDDAYDATLPMLAPNRASRAQGRALASATARVWNELEPITEHVRRGPAHHAPIFGAVFGSLGITPDETLAVYLHGAARGILSAGVRLGLLGPLEAQRLHADRAPLFAELLDAACHLEPAHAAQTAPLIEIFSALHDRLDGRMFQS